MFGLVSREILVRICRAFIYVIRNFRKLVRTYRKLEVGISIPILPCYQRTLTGDGTNSSYLFFKYKMFNGSRAIY